MATPSIYHRSKKSWSHKNQPGTIVSFTTVQNPPAGFPQGSRTIGLIELEDGTRVMGQLNVPENTTLEIGMEVMPRMKLQQVNEQGLRIYDVAYELVVGSPVKTPRRGVSTPVIQGEFPGYIIALTGPSGVGKSTVSMLMGKTLNEHVEKVPILTTREPKDGDDGEYRYISPQKFAALRRTGKLAALTDIPSESERRRYGYLASDIESIWSAGKTPVVVTELELLQGLSDHFGRRSILSFGLLPPGKSKRTMLSALLHRLRERSRETEEQIAERMLNAQRDLEFFEERSELFDHLLVNENLDKVLETLKGHVLKLQEA